MFVGQNIILRVCRGRQCRHFAPRTLSKSLFIFFRFFTYVVFHIFSVFFDLTGTFQVQPLSGKGWWYVYNFAWYPKCPKWSTLTRNVSICVFPVPVFRPRHPSLGRSLVYASVHPPSSSAKQPSPPSVRVVRRRFRHPPSRSFQVLASSSLLFL